MNEISQHNEAVNLSKDIISIVFLAIAWLIVYLLIGFNKIDFIRGNNELAQSFIFLFGFGLVHWKYSKTISYLYALNKIIIPFAPTITPRITLRLGQTFTIVALVIFCILVFKIVNC
jgi:hypothetical protein